MSFRVEKKKRNKIFISISYVIVRVEKENRL